MPLNEINCYTRLYQAAPSMQQSVRMLYNIEVRLFVINLLCKH